MLHLALSALALTTSKPEMKSSHGRKLSYEAILGYNPGSKVTDHSNIDLDQAAIETALGSLDYTTATAIYTNGAHSKPKATCTISPALVAAVAAKASFTFTTTATATVTGKFADDYAIGETSISFTYPVASERSTNSPAGYIEPLSSQCYEGGLTTTSSQGCIADGTTFDVSGTTHTVSSCTNKGGRTLKGFSTGAEGKMYTCSPDIDPLATYPAGCPYTSYVPYYNYYGVFDYANQIVLSGLNAGSTVSTFTNGGFDMSAQDGTARKEIIKKGTAYMNSWMYVIREFEDAIDDCSIGDLTANSHSSGPVHAWDEGVAFYAGSLMTTDMLLAGGLQTLDDEGKMAYTLANKRCQNFKTCGVDGDALVGEAKANLDLFDLFRTGQYYLLMGECAAIVPIKNDIVKKMTVPLIQGSLRYAYKMSSGMSATAGKIPKEKAEGAIFAAAVLPQVHACSPTHAATIFSELGINSDNSVDFNAVKAAFEACYQAMGVTCADIGGLWESGTPGAYYAMTGPGDATTGAVPGDATTVQDASPCTDSVSSQYEAILAYAPGSKVTDHANIDLDQKAMETALGSYDWTTAKAIYESGAHSKPAAHCTLMTNVRVKTAIAKGDPITFTSKNGDQVTGKAYDDYAVGEGAIRFTYPVSSDRVEPLSSQCYEGGMTSTSVLGCIATSTAGSSFDVAGIIYNGTTCVNRGYRTLQGFSTGAGSKMYTCSVTAPAGADYSVGCPYTTFVPYYNYYGVSDYADKIVLSGLDAGSTVSTFTNGGFDMSAAADVARKEITKKGTAYMNAWMYAIREFEDAIDDCSIGDLTANAHSSGPVHAWDEGVAFYTGSLMTNDMLLDGALPELDGEGKMAYTLANKRCQNYNTCGPSGDSRVGEAKVNVDLFQLFTTGQYHLLAGECSAIVPIKDLIYQKMTIPLIQGTLRYAYKMAHLSGADKEKAEGAIFAAAVLPQVHACSATHAATIFNSMNMNSASVDYMGVKTAFEACYGDMGLTCADIGGLWNSDTSAYYSSAPLTSAGSCYNAAGDHNVVCDVAEADCTGSWYEPGFTSSRSGCCHCAASCASTSDTCSYYDINAASSAAPCVDPPPPSPPSPPPLDIRASPTPPGANVETSYAVTMTMESSASVSEATAAIPTMKTNLAGEFEVEESAISIAVAAARRVRARSLQSGGSVITISIAAATAAAAATLETAAASSMSSSFGATALLGVTVTSTPVVATTSSQVTIRETAGEDTEKETMPAWAMAVIIVVAILLAILCLVLCVVFKKEKEGKPMFTPLQKAAV